MAVKRYNGTTWVTEAGAAAPLPSGMLAPFAGATAPTGWLLSDGSAVSRTTYSALFTAIGTTYGTGDGSTTFNLPDLRGRTIAGKDNMGGTAASRLTSGIAGGITSGTTLGSTGGEQSHTQTIAEMANHSHTHNGTAAANFAGSGGLQGAQATVALTINATGGGTAFNVLQPTIILNYIIKV